MLISLSAIGLISVIGIWLFGKGVRVETPVVGFVTVLRRSKIGFWPAKLPVLIARVGTVANCGPGVHVLAAQKTAWAPLKVSQSKKKNVLFRLIGPPTLPPKLFCL